MGDYRYVWQKFFQAVGILVGKGPIKERLISALQSINVLRDSDLPDEMKSDFRKLMAEVKLVEDVHLGSIHATIMKLSEIEAHEKAQQILSLYDQITRHLKP